MFFQRFLINDVLQRFLQEALDYVETLYCLNGSTLQAAGHPGTLEFQGEKLKKKTKLQEAANYGIINSTLGEGDQYASEL